MPRQVSPRHVSRPTVHDVMFMQTMINYLNWIFTNPIKFGVKLIIDTVDGQLSLTDRTDYISSSDSSLMVLDFQHDMATIPFRRGNHIIVWSAKSMVPPSMLIDFKHKTRGLCIFWEHGVYIIVGPWNLYYKSKSYITDIVRASQTPRLISTW